MRSENDKTPQSPDQWTNCPFIGQQVGNCKSFTLTHYLADLFAMHRGPRSIPFHTQHHIQLTSLSFQVSRPPHSWVTAISIFYLQNLRSNVMGEVKVWSHIVSLTFYRLTSLSFHVNRPSHSWDMIFKTWPWKFKVNVMEEVNIESHNVGPTFYRLTWHPFLSMSIGHPIPGIQYFQNLTLKIQGQGHGWGGHWKSQHGSNILSTQILLIPCQLAIPFLRYDFIKIWPWKS